IRLLLLIGSTIAQYDQQMHIKSRPVQKGMQSAYGAESSLNISPSKRKYFPAGGAPRPDFKYTKNRKRIIAHNRHLSRNNAFNAFMQSNGKVKFTIRNLGPYPKYGPFSRRPLGYNAKFNRKGQE
uniref:Uncharacterized protein n=1 Tax=Parascaris univalens TaxID=6257 RepID=A0A915AW24_PARUN